MKGKITARIHHLKKSFFHNYLCRFQHHVLTKTRLEAFSDAVFAIVVTLLVLEIRVPVEAHTDQLLFDGILHLLPKILSWIISFFIIIVVWINHHAVIHHAKHSDYGLLWINAMVLLSVSFIPFLSALLGEYPASPLAVSIFGLVMGVMGGLMTCMRIYVERHLTDDDHHVSRRFFVRLIIFGSGMYFLAAGLAWVNIYLAYALLVFVPAYFFLPREEY